MGGVRFRRWRLGDSGRKDEDEAPASRPARAARRGDLARASRDNRRRKVTFPVHPLGSALHVAKTPINAALRRLGFAQGRNDRPWLPLGGIFDLNESGLWNADAIERQLAHVDNDSMRNAYARADFWDERVRMMAWWADSARKCGAAELSFPCGREAQGPAPRDCWD